MLASIFGDWVQDGLLSRQTELELGRIVQLGLSTQKLIADSVAKCGHSLSLEGQAGMIGVSSSGIEVYNGSS